jgi:hypothetical protein
MSENLIRKYIKDKKISLSKEAIKKVTTFKNNEDTAKNKGNISVDIMNHQKVKFLSCLEYFHKLTLIYFVLI